MNSGEIPPEVRSEVDPSLDGDFSHLNDLAEQEQGTQNKSRRRSNISGPDATPDIAAEALLLSDDATGGFVLGAISKGAGGLTRKIGDIGGGVTDGIGKVTGKLGDGLEVVGEVAKDAGSAAIDITGSAGKAVGEAAGDVIGGIFDSL